MITIAGERQALYLPVGDPNRPAFRNSLNALDVVLPLSRDMTKRGLYPPIDPLTARSYLLERRRTEGRHSRIL